MPVEQTVKIAAELNWSESFTANQVMLVSQGNTGPDIHSAVIHLAQKSKDVIEYNDHRNNLGFPVFI